jgi:hypothetical protein
MKLIITESQLSNLVADIHEDSGDNISQRDGYLVHGGWKEEDREKHEKIYKRMRTIYTALRNGSGKAQILDREKFPPFEITYELPPPNMVEFSIGYPRGSWDKRPSHNPDKSTMTIMVDKRRINWKIENLDDFVNHPQLSTMRDADDLVRWIGNDMIKYVITPKFEKFHIHLF